MSLQFYNASMITTENGNLVINTNTEDTKWKGWYLIKAFFVTKKRFKEKSIFRFYRHPYEKKYVEMKRHFKSGMLQSWNKFCFTGGIIEVDVQFPGNFGFLL